MDIGIIEIDEVSINFVIDEAGIWVSMADMLKIETGDPDWAADAGWLVANAKRRYPEAAAKYLNKFPRILKSRKLSKAYTWHYRIDTDFALLGISKENAFKMHQKIHNPILAWIESK